MANLIDRYRREATGSVMQSIGRGATAAPGAGSAFSDPKYAWMIQTKAVDDVRMMPIGTSDDDPASLVVADPDQPRWIFDEREMQELTDSIGAIGQREAISVRRVGDKFVVIDGGRRLAACRRAGLLEIRATIEAKPLTPLEVLRRQLAGNLQRVDLQPIEAAKSFRKFLDDGGMKVIELAEFLGLDHNKVHRLLNLANCNPEIQGAVEAKVISATQASEIGTLKDPADQAEVFRKVREEGLSRAETVEVVREVKARKPRGQAKSGPAKPSAKPAPKAKGRTKPKWTFKVAGRIEITAERASGIDLDALLAAAEDLVDQVRRKIAEKAPRVELSDSEMEHLPEEQGGAGEIDAA